MSEEKDPTILYKCPYCVAGRFTAEDGWGGAVRHIKTHTEGSKKKSRERRKRDPLLEEDAACYPEVVFAPM